MDKLTKASQLLSEWLTDNTVDEFKKEFWIAEARNIIERQMQYIKKENESWTCTDEDNQQYGRQLSERIFEFKERGYTDIIKLDDYNLKEINNIISSYYLSIEELKKEYKENSDWIIAECIFEQESGLY